MENKGQSSIIKFGENLAKYGQADHLQQLLQAVRSSYLTAGRLPSELSESDALILQQLGIGWPILSNEGNAIGRELIKGTIRLNTEELLRLTSNYPPRIVALFVTAATRGPNIYSLRVPEEVRDFDNLEYINSLSELISHRKLQPYVVRLGQDLVKHELAITYSGPAYKEAKWVAVFIHFPAEVAQELTNSVERRQSSLTAPEELLSHYHLLQRTTVPSTHEFNYGGLSEDKLKEYIQRASDQGAISKLVDDGPAFLILNRVYYKELVLKPIFDALIEEMQMSQVKREDRKPPAAKPNIMEGPKPVAGWNVIVGDDQDTDTGLIGLSPDKATVALDMFVGTREHEERAHTISVFGIPRSGKSYTLGVILEMALTPQPGIRQGNALPAVVFHYDQNTTYRPEFAKMVEPTSVQKDIEILGKLGIRPAGVTDVVVLVPPWRVATRAAEFPNAKVEPLTFSPHELGQHEWLLLMGVPGSAALYVEQMKQLLLKLDVAGSLSLDGIRQAVADSSMVKSSKDLALQRLDMASLWIQGTSLQAYLKPGRLVILDIRDQMIDAKDAMRLCLISLGLFQRVQLENGLPMPKLVVLDEAHKYVKQEFAEEMVTVVNQMRHTATTVVIASQSPDSIPSDVLEKSSVVFLHQLTSPKQIQYLKRAVQGLAQVSEHEVSKLLKGNAIVWATASTDHRVTDSGLQIMIRPRFTRHV